MVSLIASLLTSEPSQEFSETLFSTDYSASFFDPFNTTNASTPSFIAYTIETSSTSTITTTNPPFRPSLSSSPSNHINHFWSLAARIQIPLYAIILLLAVIGNSLVMLTLIHNRRMRTITNVFLLNLSISDVLLGVLCMPFTLSGALLRDFVFGEFMCKILPFLQASSVSVSAWTLVAISCERYYAICHPLRSRRWQTLRHSYKLIALIWCGSLICMSPIAFLSQLIPTSNGHHKCRDKWPADFKDMERWFNVLLDLVLLVFPLIMLASTYSLITHTLWKGMLAERMSRRHSRLDEDYDTMNSNHMANQSTHPSNGITSQQFTKVEHYVSTSAHSNTSTEHHQRKLVGYINYPPPHQIPHQHHQSHKFHRAGPSAMSFSSSAKTNATNGGANGNGSGDGGSISRRPGIVWHHIHRKHLKPNEPGSTSSSSSSACMQNATKLTFGLRRTNTEKSLQNKKRVIKMLFVVVLEFFICWTPLYVINTVALFYPSLVYQTLGYETITYLQLLAYSSSCCNPITYCFMNRGFRKACLNLFRCCRPRFGGNDRRRFSMVGGVTQSSEVT